VRKFGFEWLWRIKEEPYLWRRYLHDGGVLLRLMLGNVFPLALRMIWQRNRRAAKLELGVFPGGPRSKTIVLVGDALADQVATAVPVFRDAIINGGDVTIDATWLRTVDARFFGLLLMARKMLLERGGCLHFRGLSPRVKRIFRLNRFGFLLDTDNSPAVTQADRPALFEVRKKASSLGRT
jgi:N-acetylglucosaminyldiphosphoundecaprenol N-acetyl-beta-D-mannosaminyltransferase